MRFAITLLVVWASSLSLVAAKETLQALSASEVKILLKAYLDVTTESKKRAEAYHDLFYADKLLVSKALVPYIKKDGEHGKTALEIATDLAVPGLWPQAKPLIDTGELSRFAEDYGFVVQDKGAVDFFFDRWKSMEHGSAEFESVNLSFQSHTVPLQITEKFFGYMKAASPDNPKRASAFLVVKYQVGDDMVIGPEALIAGWEKTLGLMKIHGKAFTIAGDDLWQHRKYWTFSSARKVCGNCRVSARGNGRLSRMPDKIQTGNWAISIRVYVADSADGTDIYLNIGAGNWGIRAREGNWVVVLDGGETYTLPVQKHAWSTVAFEVLDKGVGPAQPGTQTDKGFTKHELTKQIKRKLDGKEFAREVSFHGAGEVTTLTIKAGESDIVFGGVELTKLAN